MKRALNSTTKNPLRTDRPQQLPKDIIVCRRCDGFSRLDGDRFQDFMRPHWEKCRTTETVVRDLFSWRGVIEADLKGCDKVMTIENRG